MPTTSINHETNDRSNAVQVIVEVPLNGGIFAFQTAVPRYIHVKLKTEDFDAAKVELRACAETIVQRAATSGDYFATGGLDRVKQAIAAGFGSILNDKFRRRQTEAGNDAWAVSADLLGERYA